MTTGPRLDENRLMQEALKRIANREALRNDYGDACGCTEIAETALAALPPSAPPGLDVELCVGCNGTRWSEDENWTPTYPETWTGTRSPGDGLIPCGSCNFGGWDVPVASRLEQDPGGDDAWWEQDHP